MKQWFPFTDYDFYAYLTTGLFMIVAVDNSVGAAILLKQNSWTIFQGIFWIAAAYVIGQLIAAPSAALLEDVVTRRVLIPPVDILLGTRPPRARERILATLFAGRSYRPLPKPMQESAKAKAAESYGTDAVSITGELVFQAAYATCRGVPDCAARLDQFRNLYGFSRNLAFVALVAICLFGIRLWNGPTSNAAWFLILAAIIAFGAFGRFLKFYSEFCMEALRTFGVTKKS